MSDDLLKKIAREAAEAAVRVTTVSQYEDGKDSNVIIPPVYASSWLSRPVAESLALAWRKALATLALAACEQALRSCPLPSGLSEARLAEIAAAADPKIQVTPQGWATGEEEAAMLRDLLAEVTLLRRLLSDEMPAAAALRHERKEGEKVGFVTGTLAQHEADKWAASDAADSFAAAHVRLAAKRVAAAVGDAPLASPPEA